MKSEAARAFRVVALGQRPGPNTVAEFWRLNDMDGSEAQFEPVMPFFIDTEAYSDRDREMFVCGVEFQMVYQTVTDKRDWNHVIHTENESRIRMMCGKLGLPVKMVRHCDTWTFCEIPASTTI